MGRPVCPPRPGSFVLLCLAAPQSPGSPDEQSPKKRRFSGPLPQPRQGKHKRTITPTVPSSEHGHPFLKELTGEEKEGRVPLRMITPIRRHPSSSSPSSAGDCATGLCSRLMNDLPKNTVCMRVGKRPGGRPYLRCEEAHFSVCESVCVCAFVMTCGLVDFLTFPTTTSSQQTKTQRLKHILYTFLHAGKLAISTWQ